MALENFKPSFWAATVMRTLEDNLIAKKICTSEYTGEIKKAGDTVYFPGLADPTISDYTGAALSYEALEDASLKLVVNQQKSYSFLVDDIDAAQASANLKSSQIKRAAYLLQKSVDTFVLGLYAQAGANAAAITDATCDTTTILNDMGLLWQYLAENNVPDGQMWCVIPPWVKLKLMEAGIKFSINEGINGSGGIAWAKGELGFDIYVSNNVYNSNTVAAPVSSILAGSYNAIGFADQILKSEAFRHQDYFADAARGLYTYGAKVLKPKELALATLTYTAETGI